MPRNPYRSTPIVLKNELTDYSQLEQGGKARKLSVGSTEWFSWLETASRFTYKVLVGTSVEAYTTLTFRHEVKQRGGMYWVAYTKDRSGKLHKVYAGRSETLDMARLETVGRLMLEKLFISYPTFQVETAKEIFIVNQKQQSYPKRTKKPKYPSLTRAELKSFHGFTKMLDFCSQEFEKRWDRPWRWAGGKIARSHFDKNYYVWSKESNEHEYLADQRYFIITRLLHWVNHGYDTGYNHKLPNT